MRLQWILLTLALPLMAGKCGATNPSDKADPASPTAAPGLTLGDVKVQRSFALTVIDELKGRKNWTRAYALLSESGMKDRGQHLILVNEQNHLDYRWWDKAEIADAKERPLTEAEAKTALHNFAEAKVLKDLEEPSFDGITFEYWVLRHDGDNIVPEQRVYMKNPGTATDARYDAVAMTFLNLTH